VAQRADVVFPVAPPAEKAGTFLDWEGRWRAFPAALQSNALPDFRVLDALADSLDAPLGLRGVERVRAELAELEPWEGGHALAPSSVAVEPPAVGAGEAVLATWHLLLDAGSGQDGEPYLAGTAHRAIARVSPATAAELGVGNGVLVTVGTERGSVTVPVMITEMPDRVVWLPTNSARCAVRESLGADAGAVVSIGAADRTDRTDRSVLATTGER
jgi:NADH-quinone oxidoreductase subunit G